MTGRAADVLLADGTAVHLRQIRPQDAAALVALHSRFSERTRYLRYFSPYPRIPERDLRRFVEVDHRDREALVAASGDDLIAVGRYERLGPEAEEAEVAFVVEDAHQGRGVGSALLEHLAAAAREAGVGAFVAEVLPENGSMLRVFTEAGYQVDRRYADGVVHLRFPIAQTERSRQVQEGREHRTEARSIARLLTPRGVVVYGASRTGRGVGAAVLASLRDGRYAGSLVAVHPELSTVCGAPAYRTAAEAPAPLDLAVVAVPPEQAVRAVADATAAGVHGLVVLSAGFAEAGSAGAARQRELVSQVRAAGARLVGPNCLGIANTDAAVRLNATLAPRLPPAGRVGFFSQSGALGVTLLAEADRRGLGLSSFVSAGNRADVSGNDLLQYWEDDPATDVVLLYLETFGNPRKFARLARRIGVRKPIVAVASAYRPPDGAAPALGPAAVTELFAQVGVVRVETVTELFDVGLLLARQPLPAGPRVGIVTNSSALGALAVAACRASGLVVAGVRLRDVGPLAGPGDVAAALAAAVADPGVDSLVVVVAPPLPGQLGYLGADFAEVIARVGASGDKPVVATVLVGPRPAGVPTYPSVEEGVRALGRVSAYAHWLRRPAGTVPDLAGVDRAAARAVLAGGLESAGSGEAAGSERAVIAGGLESAGFGQAAGSDRAVIAGGFEPAGFGQAAGSERAAADGGVGVRRLLAAYGVAVVPSLAAGSAPAAVAAAGRLGYPVAVKAARPGLRHRPDLGAVRLDLADAEAVTRAYADLAAAFGAQVIVQPTVAPGVACVVEVRQDPVFGPVVGFGLGGVATDLLGDRAFRAVPLTDRDAIGLVDGPRAAALLHGYRGAQPVDTGALVDLVLRVGRLADDHPRVRTVTLNPVLARPDGCSVLHATVALGPPVPRPDEGPRRM